MHTPVFYVAVVWLSVLLGMAILQVLHHRDALDAVLAVDASALVLIAVLLVQTVWSGSSHYLDPALVVALLSFVETVAVAALLTRGGLFR